MRGLGLLWFATGLPVAAALFFLPFQVIVWCLIAFAPLQVAHQISPVAMSWMNGQFRQLMLVDRRKFLLLPAVVFVVAVAVPFAWTAGLYFAWNIYHYAMQHFGVLNLCRRVPQRWRVEISIGVMLATISMFLMPFVVHGRVVTALILAGGVNHWVTDLWLSSRAATLSWVFLLVVGLIGLTGFVIWSPTEHGVHPRAEWLVQVGMALGFIHFLYSRWVWQLRNPSIRAALGIA